MQIDASFVFDAVSVWSNLQTICGKYQKSWSVPHLFDKMNQEITDPSKIIQLTFLPVVIQLRLSSQDTY